MAEPTAGAARRGAKRQKIMSLLEACGLDKEANRLQTLSGSAALAAPQCQALCLQLVRQVELQRELTELRAAEDRQAAELEGRLKKSLEMEAKVEAKRLLLEVRNVLDAWDAEHSGTRGHT
ncbi:unnamed protein product [Symbiodinium natans]|uniref:Uncharacterized protein n=1 Tax=Symbiodinium natans TaxID=878477 RepID=A0A812R7G7_9DINO|nr:unnamed protein product [Symbiodinium natans]